jgi:hypothetical protein
VGDGLGGGTGRSVAVVVDGGPPAQPRPALARGAHLDRRREFDQGCRELVEAGVPLKSYLEQAWRDFAGWRVNYGRVLALAALTMAPYAPWSSDRSMIARNGMRHRRRARSGA